MILWDIADAATRYTDPVWSRPPHREPSGGRAVDVAGLQGSFPMSYDRPEWSRSTPQHFLEKYFFHLKS